MRTFYVTDIHGNFNAFTRLLDHVNFDPMKDKLIIGGDMINRGPKSADVLHWIKERAQSYPDNIVIIAGNHEEMMIWFMKEISPMWMEFGWEETMNSFRNKYGSDKAWDIAEEYAAWFETLPLLYEDEHGVYVHAGVDIHQGKEQQPDNILWINDRELSTLDELELTEWSNDKYIFRGHNPKSNVQVIGNFVNCDLGSCVFSDSSAALALVEVNEKRYFKCMVDGDITLHKIIGMQ
ncbi:metallophosphoesterase family protein [Oceanobacillus chungangensis]|uniref:metallophosphoesterase family protein n=1 Tax=Oceanobacillus chungangensis TaxID=1229152 RepID=UPI001475F6E2|nr:metallophosphoesterase family protein [Oceanobacillus chungangensis]